MNRNTQKELPGVTPLFGALIACVMITLGNFAGHNSTFANAPAVNPNPSNEQPVFFDADSQRAALLAEARKKSIAWKNAGNTMWGSETWMKDSEYYQGLTTEQLAEECFARSIFGFEMSIFDDPAVGFIRLEVHHNGFAELFKRDDMYKGILHVYHQFATDIDPQNDIKTIVGMSINLDGMSSLYNYPPFSSQLKGHEKDFLNANIQVLQQCLKYLNTPDPETGGERSLYFYGEVASVARIALFLVKRIDPAAYSTIAPKIESYRWPREQKNEYLRQYLQLVLGQLEPFSTSLGNPSHEEDPEIDNSGGVCLADAAAVAEDWIK